MLVLVLDKLSERYSPQGIHEYLLSTVEIIQNEVLSYKVESHYDHVTDIGQKLDTNFCLDLEPRNCFSSFVEIPYHCSRLI